jgi:hypothetical protein
LETHADWLAARETGWRQQLEVDVRACMFDFGTFMLMSVLTNGCLLYILCIVKSYCYIYITIKFDVIDIRSIAGTGGVSLSPS